MLPLPLQGDSKVAEAIYRAMFGKLGEELDNRSDAVSLLTTLRQHGLISPGVYDTNVFLSGSNTDAKCGSRAKNSARDIVIADMKELRVLGALGIIEEYVPKNRKFLVLSLSPVIDDGWEQCVENEFEILWDARASGLFEPCPRDRICTDKLAFVGKAPANPMRSAQKSQLSRIVSGLMRAIEESPLNSSGKRSSLWEYPASIAQEIANMVLFSDEFRIADKKARNAAGWKTSILSRIYMRPSSNEKIYQVTEQLIQLQEAVSLWEYESTQPCNASLVNDITQASNMSAYLRAIENFGANSGAEADIKAWKSGVPISDIIA